MQTSETRTENENNYYEYSKSTGQSGCRLRKNGKKIEKNKNRPSGGGEGGVHKCAGLGFSCTLGYE